MKNKIQPLIKALKQAGRIVLVAVIPLIVNQLQSETFDWKGIAITGAIALLMAIDKYLHEVGKETENENLIKGLTRF